MSTEVETSLEFSERAARAYTLQRRKDQRFLDPFDFAQGKTFARNDNFRGRAYSFQTVFPPAIVRTARPFNFQPSNGELREAD